MRIAFAVLVLLAAAPLFAAPPQTFESFVDDVMAREMAESHVPGAVVLVVRDGKVVFQKGYGYANLETKEPVVAERTIFRIGSITKVFTATAAMQLAERGKWKLTDDVNAYLPTWKVPATYRQPITIANLLTHTAGLDEISSGRKADSPGKLIPLGEFLPKRIVRRQPPSTTISYSTYNMALAGYLVESVSKMPLGDWFAANIFGPLSMTHTSLGVVPAAQQRDLAVGYDYSGGRHRPLAFEYFHTYPASDINSTATDMGSFLLAMLDGGKILSAESTRAVQQRQFANHPRLAGMTYGWFENRRNGVAAIEHGGVMDGYSALLYIAPQQRFGVYVAGNIENSNFPIAVRNEILDREIPDTTKVTPPVAIDAPLARFAGSYRNDIWCHSCPAGSRGYFPSPVKVTANPDRTISFWGGKWVQVEPLVFQLTGGQLDTGERIVAFREDGRGRITHFFNATWSHERVEPPRAAVRVPVRTLRRYAGRYELAPGRFIDVALSGDHLTATMTGQASADLVPMTKTTFVASGADAEITFGKGALTLRFGGKEMKAVKVP